MPQIWASHFHQQCIEIPENTTLLEIGSHGNPLIKQNQI